MSNLQAKRVAYLERQLELGFCLHGSPHHGLRELQPRPAHCNTGRPEGNLLAVYASKTGVQVPIVAALLHGSGRSVWSGQDGRLRVWGNRSLAPGTVYVLPADSFKDVRGEWVSFTSVQPVAAMRVTPSVLRFLIERGTLDLEIPIPAPW